MENKVKRAIIMTDDTRISAKDLGLAEGTNNNMNLRQVRQQAEMKAINGALSTAAGNISAAAKLLGITRPTLYDLVKKYNINIESD